MISLPYILSIETFSSGHLPADQYYFLYCHTLQAAFWSEVKAAADRLNIKAIQPMLSSNLSSKLYSCLTTKIRNIEEETKTEVCKEGDKDHCQPCDSSESLTVHSSQPSSDIISKSYVPSDLTQDFKSFIQSPIKSGNVSKPSYLEDIRLAYAYVYDKYDFSKCTKNEGGSYYTSSSNEFENIVSIKQYFAEVYDKYDFNEDINKDSDVTPYMSSDEYDCGELNIL
mmetsp:Transcript_28834/g.29170  ORF Transcript_28834/g.29170 Transcript_28834/m.29170 type:complete len:226 (-) Transcript_28834:39-716(-)